MELPGLNTTITADNSDLKAKLNESGQAVEAYGKETGDTLKGINETTALAAAAAVAAIGVAFAAFAKQSVDAYGEAESAVRRLDAAANARGLGTASKDLQNLAAAIQKVTGASADMTVQLSAELVAQGKSQAQIEKMIKAAADLSAVTGDDLSTSLGQLNNSLSGMARELGRTNPEIKALTEEQLKAGAAIDIISEKYAGYAATMNDTVQVSNKVLAETMGDLQEAFGQLLAPAVVMVNDALTGMAEVGMEIIAFANSVPGPIKTVVGVMLALTAATVAAAVASVALNTAKVQETITSIVTVAKLVAETIARWANYAATMAMAVAQATLNPAMLAGVIAAVALTAAIVAGAVAYGVATGEAEEFARSQGITTREIKALSAQLGVTEDDIRSFLRLQKNLGADGIKEMKALKDATKDYQDALGVSDFQAWTMNNRLHEMVMTSGDLNGSVEKLADKYKLPVEYVRQIALTNESIVNLQKEQAAALYDQVAAYQQQVNAISSITRLKAISEGSQAESTALFLELKKEEFAAIAESGRMTLTNLKKEVNATGLAEQEKKKIIADATKVYEKRWKENEERNKKELESIEEKRKAELAAILSGVQESKKSEEKKLEDARLATQAKINFERAQIEAKKKLSAEDITRIGVLAAASLAVDEEYAEKKKKLIEDLAKAEKEAGDSVKAGNYEALKQQLGDIKITSQAELDAYNEKVRLANLAPDAEAEALKKGQDALKAHLDAQTQMYVGYFNQIVGFANELSNALQANYQSDADKQIAELDRAMQAEMEAAGLAEQTKAEKLQAEYEKAVATGDAIKIDEAKKAVERNKIQEEYEKKKRKIEYDSAVKQWETQRTMAYVNAAQAIISVWAGTADTVTKVIESLAVAAITAVQVSTIENNKPMLWTGTANPIAEAGQFIVGDQGPELVSLPKGSSVANNRDTMNMIGGGAGVGTRATIQIMMDGRMIAENTADLINNGLVRIEVGA